MCGIAGSFRLDGRAVDPWVEPALERIAHRGPDGRGVNQWGPATHGHVRLSIMDPLPRSDQPFIYGGVLLSFVGEIWNYREIRTRLREVGYEFETTGDTEVLACFLNYTLTNGGYEEIPLALEELEGQYAFAFTESISGKTWLVRDRYGEVPLYVLADEDQGSLFSLEPPSIRWASERKVFGERGADANPVPAGCFWPLGGIPEPYYDVRVDGLDRRNMLYGPEEVRGALETAIDRRLQADVPVCCLISGGVDSASILRLVKDRKPDVVAYTIVFDEKGPDLREARWIAKELEVPLVEVPVPMPDDASLREAIRCIEITMKAQIEIALHCLPLAERIYADGFRVVLSGEGADELFGGYGMLAKKLKTKGEHWGKIRLEGVEKMARGNFIRINKAFMHAGVEARTPFMDRGLVEGVLPLTLDECPLQKVLLRDAMEGLLPDRTRLRKKLSFQTGSGMRDHMEDHLNGAQQRAYNATARTLFGGIPRG